MRFVAAALSLLAANCGIAQSLPSTLPFQTSAVAQHSGFCLEVPAASSTADTQLRQATCRSTNEQRIDFQPVSGKFRVYQLRMVHSGLCLDLRAGGTSSGTAIVQNTCTGGSSQQFRLEKMADGTHARLRNLGAGRCLQIASSSTSANANVQIESCLSLTSTARSQNFALAGATTAALGQPATPSASERDAARLLTQATFGPTPTEIQRVANLGAAAWVDEQMARPASLHLERLNSHYAALLPAYNVGRTTPETTCIQSFLCRHARRDVWWQIALTGQDQLRQRVAFALSQFFVISDLNSDVAYTQLAPADFYDTLVTNAFGNYRTLLEEVTLHPAMGRYLGVLQNEKANPSRNTEPDENYAREVMQLFSIGLSELNPDGSVRTENGQPITSYDDDDISNFARVFTGWNFGNATRWSFSNTSAGIPGYLQNMAANEAYHDTGSKVLLNNVAIAGGRTAAADLASGLDNLANHPNVGPFLSRHLIQQLVTSNPSPAYVGRVAAVFANNGRGVRGDLGAVVRAILLDTEARTVGSANSYGKTREPLLRFTAMWRAFNVQPVGLALPDGGTLSPIYRFYSSDSLLAQAPLSAPSVFNFYRPNYRRPGELKNLGLFSPEMQILNDNTAVNIVNRLHGATVNADRDATSLNRVLSSSTSNTGNQALDFSAEKPLAVAPEALVNRLDLLLMAGAMPAEMRSILTESLFEMSMENDGRTRVEDAVFLITSSPQFAIQR